MSTDILLETWMKFDNNGDDEPTYEANTFERDGMYVVAWYHNDVGLVTEVEFDTLAASHAWYERNDFDNYTA